MSEQNVKLALCIPCLSGDVKMDFAHCLAQMSVIIATTPFEEGQHRELLFLEKRTSNLPRARQELLEDAQLQNCTHALFLDTDQSFPMDLLHRLIAHKKPVVACNIALKTLPSFPTARARGPSDFGTPVFSNGNQTGLEKVWRVGTGVMLIDLAVLKNLPKPWFETVWDAKNEQFQGEDWYFVDKLQKAGVEVHIDHQVSREIGHIGNFTYTHAHMAQYEQQEAA